MPNIIQATDLPQIECPYCGEQMALKDMHGVRGRRPAGALWQYACRHHHSLGAASHHVILWLDADLLPVWPNVEGLPLDWKEGVIKALRPLRRRIAREKAAHHGS